MPQISNRVYHITTQFFINIYLIRGDEGYTLVDTGTSGKIAIKGIDAALKDLAATWDDIHTIVITHAHFDHIGGLAAVQARTQAMTCAHAADTPIIQGNQPPLFADPADLGLRDRVMLRFLEGSKDTPPAVVDTMLEDGDALDTVAPDALVVHLSGHSYGQIGIWLPAEETLIGGDVMMHLPWGLSLPIRTASPDWVAVHRAIERVADLAPRNLCLGHGAPLTVDTAEKINRFYQSHQHPASL